ncbi:MAG: hypothetical protein ACM3N7_03745 [Planctomycetaceae bacterium]
MSEEENLVREALQKIRGWLKKKKRAAGGEFVPRLAIKFCGGCNPVIERGEVARKIRKELAGARWGSWEKESDLLVLINGCPTACAEREEIHKNSKASLIIHPGGVSGIEVTHRAKSLGRGEE